MAPNFIAVETIGSTSLEGICFTFTKQQIFEEPSEYVRIANTSGGLKKQKMKQSVSSEESQKLQGKSTGRLQVKKAKAEPADTTVNSDSGKIEKKKRAVAKKHTGKKRSVSQVSRDSPVAELSVKKWKAETGTPIRFVFSYDLVCLKPTV